MMLYTTSVRLQEVRQNLSETHLTVEGWPSNALPLAGQVVAISWQENGEKPEIMPVDVVERFVQQVNRMAELNMIKTGKLEGAHYAAMNQLLQEMRARTCKVEE